ncbi:MAG: hypothetical protein AAB649_01845, partial [Patescibacteria group bacterium]
MQYLKSTASYWHQTIGIDGFIITSLPANWNNDPVRLKQTEKLAIETNSACRKAGLEHNFLKTALGHNALPDYFNDAAWLKISDYFKMLGAYAKRTGFIGIAIDTESYSKL